MTAAERVAMLADEGTFREVDADMVSVDVLKFTGVAAYSERLRTYHRQTGMNDAVMIGLVQARRPRRVAGGDGFQFSGREHGVGGRRKDHPRD